MKPFHIFTVYSLRETLKTDKMEELEFKLSFDGKETKISYLALSAFLDPYQLHTLMLRGEYQRWVTVDGWADEVTISVIKKD